MKFFNRDGKYNFIDDNNCFVGFDNSQSCCELADWFIADKPMDVICDRIPEDVNYWPDFQFDKDYFQVISSGHFDEGGMAIFKLINTKNNSEIYLHIFNCHNGYYGHGFNFTVDGNIKQEGYL